MRAPLSWLREYVDLPAGDDRPKTSRPSSSGSASRRRRSHRRRRHRPARRRPGADRRAEPQRTARPIRWCQVDVGARPTAPSDAAGHRLRRAQLRRRRQGRGRPARRRAARRLRDRRAQDLRPRLRRHDLLRPRAGHRRRPRRHHRALRLGATSAGAAPTRSSCSGSSTRSLDIDVTPDRGYCFSHARRRPRVRASPPAPLPRPGRRSTCPRPTATGYPVRLADDARSTAGRLRPLRRPHRRAASTPRRRRRRGCSAGCSRPACARSRSPSTSPTT